MKKIFIRPLVVTIAIVGVMSFVAPMALGQSRDERREQRRLEQIARAQERIYEQIQEALGCSDDEWTVLQPRITNVLGLQAEVDSANAGIASLTGRGRPSAVRGSVDPASKVVQASQYLEQAINDPSINPDQLRTALNLAREARAEAILRLRAARKELIQLLTIRQEAVMFQMGLIE